MSISELYNKLALLSPRMEVVLRTIYWKNYKLLRRFKPKSSLKPTSLVKIDFDKIIDYVRTMGVGEGSLLIVHSSYGSIKGSGLSPDDIIDKLLELIGPTGTLAMPAIRQFPEEATDDDFFKDFPDDKVFVYDVQQTPISTGVLPIRLHSRKGSITSRFPLNPMCAIGPLAEEMMAHSLESISPHDEHSAWKYCADHNAFILGIGIDLAHYLTMIHVAEEAYPGWPIKDWFRKRNFVIIDGDFQTNKTVLERRPKWGMLHLADKRYTKDFKDEGILIEENIESTRIGLIESQKLIQYLNARKNEGYPYIVRKKDFIQ